MTESREEVTGKILSARYGGVAEPPLSSDGCTGLQQQCISCEK